MPNQLSDAVFQTLLAALPKDRPVTRQDLAAGPAPEAIGHFLQHALDRRLELETARIRDVAAGWVDHESEAVALARTEYLRRIAAFAHYPAAEWPRALRQAVQLVCAYLILPVPTLIHFVFGERRTELPPHDVERRVAYFLGYGHLRAAVGAFMERRPDHLLGRRELADALETVDRRICSDYGSADWSGLVRPLTELADITPAGAVDIRLLTQFFEARDGHAIASGIRGYARARELTLLTGEQVEAAILLAADDGSQPEDPVVADGEITAESSEKPFGFALRLNTEPAPTERAGQVDEAASESEVIRFTSDPVAAPADPDEIAFLSAPEEPPARPEVIRVSSEPEASPAETEVSGPKVVSLSSDAQQEASDEPDTGTKSDIVPEPYVVPHPVAEQENVMESVPAEPPPFAPVPLIISNESEQEAEAIFGQVDVDRQPDSDPHDHAPQVVAPDAPETGEEPANEEPVPLWLRFRAEASDGDPVGEPTPSAPAPDAAEPEPLWKKFQNSAEGEPEPEVPTSRVVRLHPAIEPEPIVDSATVEFAVLGPSAWQRDAFIERIFHGSSDSYFEALTSLMSAPDWRSASNVLAVDVFRANRVNIYDEVAIDFTNAVESQFQKRTGEA